MAYDFRHWTNPSVRGFAQGEDPVSVVQSKARKIVLEAVEDGWEGPPFDPFQLADMRGIRVSPSDDVQDARIVPDGSNRLRIEFNPHRPQARTRFSVAHEIAHTMFPDCADQVRNRLDAVTLRSDEWELELLCNIGAAELLMPTRDTGLPSDDIDIDNLLRLRTQFQVSTEAVLIRVAKLTSKSCSSSDVRH